MKAVFCLAIFAALTVVALSEMCRRPEDCSHVLCPETDYSLVCDRGECTCNHNTATCTSRADCDGLRHCDADKTHCVDGRCRCGF